MASRYVNSAPPIDAVAGVGIGTSQAHHKIHEGDSFVVDYIDTEMEDTAYIGVGFTTPAASSGLIHILVAFASKTSAHIDMIESPSLGQGTSITAFNRRRDSTNVTSVTNLKSYNSADGDTIIVGGGVVVHDFYVWADKKATGQGGRAVDEFVLAPLTEYAFKLTADAGSNAGQIILNFYEHVDSNA